MKALIIKKFLLKHDMDAMNTFVTVAVLFQFLLESMSTSNKLLYLLTAVIRIIFSQYEIYSLHFLQYK